MPSGAADSVTVRGCSVPVK